MVLNRHLYPDRPMGGTDPDPLPREEWIDTGQTYGFSKIYACGKKHKLMDPTGQFSDFHYNIEEE